MKKKGCDIKIIVAAHMAYRMPDDTLYLPLHVGAEGKKDLGPGYQKDNTGGHESRGFRKVGPENRLQAG